MVNQLHEDPYGQEQQRLMMMMLQLATEDLCDEVGFYILYRNDGSLFNLQHLKAHTKTLEQLIRELLFADGAALVANTETAIQCVTSCFAEAVQLSGLDISLKKTDVLHQPAPQEANRPPYITVGETELKAVRQLTLLGSAISDAKIKEMENSLAKANSVFRRLYSHVWSNKQLKKATQVSVYTKTIKER